VVDNQAKFPNDSSVGMQILKSRAKKPQPLPPLSDMFSNSFLTAKRFYSCKKTRLCRALLSASDAHL
jgi:hypothetical protein